tara:strand:- start:487 stop:1005 length:519 start_codon:yes stop_codon:yes gene_type:complete
MIFSFNKKKNTVNLDEVNIYSVLSYLRERDFMIVEMRDLKNKLIYKDDGKDFINNNVSWVKDNHGIEINSIINLIKSKYGISFLHIKFYNNDFIIFSNNILKVCISNKQKLRQISTDVLKFHGLFVSKLIWNISEITGLSLVVDSLLGYDYHEIEDELINLMNISYEKISGQ